MLSIDFHHLWVNILDNIGVLCRFLIFKHGFGMYDVRDGQNRPKYHASEYQRFCISLHTLQCMSMSFNAYDTRYKRYSGMVRRPVANTAIFSDSISKYLYCHCYFQTNFHNFWALSYSIWLYKNQYILPYRRWAGKTS